MCIGMTELQKQSLGGVLQLYSKRESEFFKFFNNTLRLNFCFLKIIRFLYPCYRSKIVGNVQHNVVKCFIIPLPRFSYIYSHIHFNLKKAAKQMFFILTHSNCHHHGGRELAYIFFSISFYD